MNSLAKFSYDKAFQIKLIATVLRNENSLRNMISIVEGKYFTIPILSSAWILICKVYADEHIVLSSDMLGVYLNKIVDIKTRIPRYDQEEISRLIIELKEANTADSALVEKEVQEFCKKSAYLILLSDSIDDINSGNFDILYNKFSDLFARDFSQEDLGMDYFKDISARYIGEGPDQNRVGVIPTGLEEFDLMIGGGLATQELGCILSASGRGKSAMLLNFAYNASIIGKSVLFLSFEMTRVPLAHRLDKIFMQAVSGIENFVPTQLLHTLKEIQRAQTSKIRIKDFPPGEVSVAQIYSFIKGLEAHGEKYDLIIVDYLGELKLPKAEERDVQYKILATELRALSHRLCIPVWTAFQTNRASLQQEILYADSIAESYATVRVFDIAATIGGDVLTHNSGYANLTTIKNRFGPNEKTIIVKFLKESQRFITGSQIGKEKEIAKLREEVLSTSCTGSKTVKIKETGLEALKKNMKKRQEEIVLGEVKPVLKLES